MLNASRGAQPVGAEDPLASTVLHLNQGRRARRLSTPRNTRLCIALRIVARRDPAYGLRRLSREPSEVELCARIGRVRPTICIRAPSREDWGERFGDIWIVADRGLELPAEPRRRSGLGRGCLPGPVDPAPLTGSPASGESRACRCGGRRPAWPPGHVQSPAGASSAQGREVGGTLEMRVVPAEQVCRDRSLAPPRD